MTRRFNVQQIVEKEWNMLRQAQHERILVNHFKTHSVRPEHGRRTPNGFLTASQCSKSRVLCRAGAATALTSAIFLLFATLQSLSAADKLIGIHSARVLSQSMPWVATEAGLFKKYNLDFDLVFIASSPSVTAAMLGGDAEISLGGGEGPIRAYVQGASDFVFVGGFKNVLTHSILARTDIKRPADLKGKKIGINRVGSNPHYFAVQALRRSGIEPNEVNFIQSGGAPETLVALLAGGLDAASLNPPTDAQAIAKGLHYVIFGPDLRLPYAATVFFTRRSLVAKRQPVVAQFLRAMAEAGKIIHSDKEFVYKVMGKICVSLTERSLTQLTTVRPKSLKPSYK